MTQRNLLDQIQPLRTTKDGARLYDMIDTLNLIIEASDRLFLCGGM